MEHNRQRPEPYVGISGVVNTKQQAHSAKLAERAGLSAKRQLLLGVKAVHNTQYLDKPNKYGPEWYPVGAEDFANALSREVAPTYGVAQVYFDTAMSTDAGYRDRFTQRIVHRGHVWLDGIQYDQLPWHTDDDVLDYLAGVKEKYGVSILLQCHNPAMQELGPKGVASRLGRLAACLDYVLLDASHGTGTRLRTDYLRPFVEAVYSAAPLDHVGVGIAGGLDAHAVREDLPVFLEQFPDLSWDAEGRLHTTQPDNSCPLDMRLVAPYLQASSDVLS